jgi:DNA-binding MarR family transcriptional regulator
MMRPVVHVAVTNESDGCAIEQVAMRRPITEMMIVYPIDHENYVDVLVERFQSLRIPITSIPVVSYDFSNILSSILRSLNDRRLDDYQIEFNVTTSTGLMAVAACMAATLVNATVICSGKSELSEITEVWPSELVNLSHRKREILEYLATKSEPIYQTDITRCTGVQRSGVSRHLRALENAGYVNRTRRARCKFVKITNLGLTVLYQKQLRKRRIWGQITDHLPQISQVVGRAHG